MPSRLVRVPINLPPPHCCHHEMRLVLYPLTIQCCDPIWSCMSPMHDRSECTVPPMITWEAPSDCPMFCQVTSCAAPWRVLHEARLIRYPLNVWLFAWFDIAHKIYFCTHLAWSFALCHQLALHEMRLVCVRPFDQLDPVLKTSFCTCLPLLISTAVTMCSWYPLIFPCCACLAKLLVQLTIFAMRLLLPQLRLVPTECLTIYSIWYCPQDPFLYPSTWFLSFASTNQLAHWLSIRSGCLINWTLPSRPLSAPVWLLISTIATIYSCALLLPQLCSMSPATVLDTH